MVIDTQPRTILVANDGTPDRLVGQYQVPPGYAGGVGSYKIRVAVLDTNSLGVDIVNASWGWNFLSENAEQSSYFTKGHNALDLSDPNARVFPAQAAKISLTNSSEPYLAIIENRTNAGGTCAALPQPCVLVYSVGLRSQ